MKNVRMTLMGLFLMVTLAAGALPTVKGDCCDGSKCCNGKACCKARRR